MSLVDYFQSHAAGIGAMVGVLSFIGVFLWSIFKIAVGQVTTPKFTRLEQGLVTVEKGQIKLEQGQDSLKESYLELRQGQTQLQQDIANLVKGQSEIRGEITSLVKGQGEIRGEVTSSVTAQAETRVEMASLVAGQVALNQRLDRIETLLLERQRQPVS